MSIIIIKTLIDCENIDHLKTHLANNSLESLLEEFIEFCDVDKSARLLKQQAHVMRLLIDLYSWQMSLLLPLDVITDHTDAYQDVFRLNYGISSTPDQYYLIIAMYKLRY